MDYNSLVHIRPLKRLDGILGHPFDHKKGTEKTCDYCGKYKEHEVHANTSWQVNSDRQHEVIR